MTVDARVRVRYAETDQMGVAYYGNYFTWFEVGRVEWCKANGFNYRDMEIDDGVMLVVAEASCRYKASARFDDALLIRTSVLRARRKLITFGYEVLKAGREELLATGETTHLVTGKDMKPRALPEKYNLVFGL